MNNEKKPLQFVELTYIGKAYTKTFTRDDKSQVKGYKYMFKKSESDEFTKNFWGFEDTKGVEHLVEGELASIGYVEKPNPKGDKPIKSVKWFGKVREITQETLAPVNTIKLRGIETNKFTIQPAKEGEYKPPLALVEWLQVVEQNAKVLKDTYGNNIPAFSAWLMTEDCDTDYFIKWKEKEDLIDKDIEVEKKQLFDWIMQRI